MTGQDFRGGGAPANKLLRGFTMAEVLITLGIIGIVAAMTIPGLMGKYKMKAFEVAFKKQYSVLQNALNYITAEYGIGACYIYYTGNLMSYEYRTDECLLLEKYLIESLNLKEYDGDDLKTKYADQETVYAQGGESVNRYCNYSHFVRNANVYRTNDGTILMFDLKGDVLQIILDVNAEGGPNKWGYDVFMLALSNHNKYTSMDNQIYLTDEFCSIIEKGGKYPRTILRNQKFNNEDEDFLW